MLYVGTQTSLSSALSPALIAAEHDVSPSFTHPQIRAGGGGLICSFFLIIFSWARSRHLYPCLYLDRGSIYTDWEVYSDRERTAVMSTDPDATRDNFPRDMQWGQALQLIEDASEDGTTPAPLRVEKGDKLELVARLSHDSAVMQFQVNRL